MRADVIKHLISLEPASREFGWDRGTPIDRAYIQRFLESQKHHIKGHVLEEGDNRYGKLFAGERCLDGLVDWRVFRGDLTAHDSLPRSAADCFICTQVFCCIHDLKRGIEGAMNVLRLGGTLLATVPCISPVSQYDATRWGYHWGIYPQAALQAFGEVFGVENVEISLYGNSLTATLYINGLCLEECDLLESELWTVDESYPVTIGIVATKTSNYA